MNFQPLHDRVAIELSTQEEKTAGGIIIPDSAKEKPAHGTVVAVGQGATNNNGDIIPLQVKVGDKVIFGKWAGNDINVEGKELKIMKESDIMGVLK